MTTTNQGRSKITYFLEGKGLWNAEQPATYMNELTRRQASTIFKTRTRMIKVKGNYKNAYTDLTCRACKIEIESQKHVLEDCRSLQSIRNSEPNSENNIDPFTENRSNLIENATKIEKLIEYLNR